MIPAARSERGIGGRSGDAGRGRVEDRSRWRDCSNDFSAVSLTGSRRGPFLRGTAVVHHDLERDVPPPIVRVTGERQARSPDILPVKAA